MGKSIAFSMTIVGLINKIIFSQSLPMNGYSHDKTYYPQDEDWLTNWIQNFSQSFQPTGSFLTPNYQSYQPINSYPYSYSDGYEQPDYNWDWNNQGNSGISYAQTQDHRYNPYFTPNTHSYFERNSLEPTVTQAISTILSTPHSPFQVKHKTIISPENPNGSGYVSIKGPGVGQNKENKDGVVYYRF